MAPHENHASWTEIEQIIRESESRAVAGQFSAAIMHEINNPLETITNLAYLIEREAEDPSKVRDYIALLQNEVSNVIRIARQTLSFFTPSNARRSVNLVELAESGLHIHERRLLGKKIKIIRDFGNEIQVQVHPGEMLQVFSNLIGNALDALPEQGCLRLKLRKRNQQVHATISDDGSGIPQEVLARIFDPFFTTKKEKGTGLGLAISKSIVEGHKGRIRVRSAMRPDRNGTVFRISLPLNESSGDEAKPGR